MENVPPRLVRAQRRCVERYLPKRVPFRQLLTNERHGRAIDQLIESRRGCPADFVHVWLDVDAIPLHHAALPYLISRAQAGVLIGCIQRSNHIANGQHVYAAPSVLAFTERTFEQLGRPSFLETARGDVGEELTFGAEANNVAVELLRPQSVLGSRRWALDGSQEPQYGNGTVFGGAPGSNQEAWFYHQYELRVPAQQPLFLAVCEAVMSGTPVQPSVWQAALPERALWPWYDRAWRWLKRKPK